MKKLALSLLIATAVIGLLFSVNSSIYAKPGNGGGGPNGTFVRFAGLDSYWKETGSGLLHEWRTTDNRHLVFKPFDKFESADCDEGYLSSFLWTAHTNYDQSYPFDEADLEDFLVVGKKYWVCIYEWDSEKPLNYPELVETLTVYANDPNGEDSTVLGDGSKYIFRVSGTAYAGDTIDFDAKYSLTNRIAGDTWTDLVSGYEGYGTKLLNLLVDGVEVDWGIYNDSHIYYLDYLGDGNTVNFAVYDIYYPNNTGSLTVEIYAVP